RADELRSGIRGEAAVARDQIDEGDEQEQRVRAEQYECGQQPVRLGELAGGLVLGRGRGGRRIGRLGAHSVPLSEKVSKVEESGRGRVEPSAAGRAALRSRRRSTGTGPGRDAGSA